MKLIDNDLSVTVTHTDIIDPISVRYENKYQALGQAIEDSVFIKEGAEQTIVNILWIRKPTFIVHKPLRV